MSNDELYEVGKAYIAKHFPEIYQEVIKEWAEIIDY